MIVCKYCGARNEEDLLFCDYCGAKLKTETPNPAASTIPKKPTAVAVPVKSGPSIPAGNRFAAHEQIVSKIARRAAQLCAGWIRNEQEWEPLHNGYSSQYHVEIIVHKDGVDFDPHSLERINRISFKSLGMADIPEAQSDAFLHALKPFLDAYFPEEINKAFSNISPLIKRTTSVTYGKYLESIDFDGRSVRIECIRLSLCYTYPPAPKLKSW